MTTITIPKKEYQTLTEKALRYDYLKKILKEDIFSSPSVRNTKMVMREFGGTGRYNKKFLESLEKGLKRSTYFK